jgi:hypothetical protein
MLFVCCKQNVFGSLVPKGCPPLVVYSFIGWLAVAPSGSSVQTKPKCGSHPSLPYLTVAYYRKIKHPLCFKTTIKKTTTEQKQASTKPSFKAFTCQPAAINASCPTGNSLYCVKVRSIFPDPKPDVGFSAGSPCTWWEGFSACSSCTWWPWPVFSISPKPAERPMPEASNKMATACAIWNLIQGPGESNGQSAQAVPTTTDLPTRNFLSN